MSTKAIKYFQEQSEATPQRKVEATIALDATDIREGKRVVADGKGGYTIVGGEAGDNLSEALGLSDTPGLQNALNLHATPLDRAIDSNSRDGTGYSEAEKSGVRRFLESKIPEFERREIDAATTYESAKQK